ncbi:M15 family metallopeptidase [Synechococcus sp. CBW1107]|uniref:M15 family metallopeptidase n=1 Tax=Synechococcus sp. CBW1107 TaxID=2789857 RepID=UPI002AD4F13B|nr:M15 family metallopeptidase [Synechococcus sp. CBW1107]
MPQRPHRFDVLAGALATGLLASPAASAQTLAPAAILPLQCSGDGLVSLTAISPRPLLELRYASPYNFMGEVLYDQPLAQLRCPVALALQQVQQDLAREGLGLKIWDAYRPLSVQERMWQKIRDPRYVSDPSVNAGRHTRGTAVDVTLVDRKGKALVMPSDFDDFTAAAHVGSPMATSEQAAHARRLQEAMERRGFVVFPTEWWHFDWKDWMSLPPVR